MGAYKFYNPATQKWEITKAMSIIKSDGSLEYTPDDIEAIENQLIQFLPNKDTMTFIEIPANGDVTAVVDSLKQPGWYLIRIWFSGASAYLDQPVNVLNVGGSQVTDVIMQIAYSERGMNIRTYNSVTNVWTRSYTISPAEFAIKIIVTGNTTAEANITKTVEIGFQPRYVFVAVYDNNTGSISMMHLMSGSNGLVPYVTKTNNVTSVGAMGNFVSTTTTITATGFKFRSDVTGNVHYLAIR